MVDNSLNARGRVIIEQFVQSVPLFSSHYGSDASISYTIYNIVGKPSNFPDYGDFPQSCVMRTYGTWWDECPSKSLIIMPQSVGKHNSQDFIDLEFEQFVHPTEIKIFETYNPGAVTKIWASDIFGKWNLLWEGEPQDIGHLPRIFSPVINRIRCPTRLLRIELYHLHLNYYTQLDAVLLKGSIGSFTDRGMSKHLATHIMNMRVPSKINISDTIKDFLGNDLPRYLMETNNSSISKSCEPSKQAKAASGKDINSLPDEMVTKIFGFLDLLSLCRCSQVSKHFYNLATDALLYKEVNLKVYWHCVTANVLTTLGNRSLYLQKLDLSWCGSLFYLTPQILINFIKMRGKHLTHLKLASCKFVDDDCIYSISEYCQELKELHLQNCVNINEKAFKSLAHLQHIEYLHLYRTMIGVGALQDILKASSHLKHINLGSCIAITNMDEVAMALGNCNPQLISIDFWKTFSLTPLGVKALSSCHNLEEVDLGWCLGFSAPGDSLHALARGCPRLKKLFLAALRGVTDRDLEPFVDLCPNIEQIDLLGVRSISPDLCERFLRCLKNLKLLDLSFCEQILEAQVAKWEEQYPNVNIKRSFQRAFGSLPLIE